MSSINNGNQVITYDYKQEIISQGFNKLNYGLHPQGIYEGGAFTKVNDSELRVMPFIMLYQDDTNEVSVRVETETYAVLDISASTPYIVGRYSWLNTEENYMDIFSISYADILETDIIFGRVQYDGSVMSTDYDYSEKTNVSKKYLGLLSNKYFNVTPTYPNSNRVNVSIGGPVMINGTKIETTSDLTSSIITMPSGSSRKDLVVLVNNSVSVLTGTSSELPLPNKDELPIAILNIPDGATVIKGSYIENINICNYYKSNYLSGSEMLPYVDITPLNGYYLDGYSNVDVIGSIRMLYSLLWVQRTLPVSADWRSVTYGNGTFVTVAYESSIAATSPDGITWTQRSMPVSADWQSVTYGNGTFVAVAYNSSIAATSPDGITWTQRALPVSSNWRSTTYDNGVFVAVASSSSIAATSPDGITWTQRALPVSASWYSITYGNDVFVAVAYGSTIAATSPDGITWIQRTLPVSAYWLSVTYGNSIFVSTTTGTIAMSSIPSPL